MPRSGAQALRPAFPRGRQQHTGAARGAPPRHREARFAMGADREALQPQRESPRQGAVLAPMFVSILSSADQGTAPAFISILASADVTRALGRQLVTARSSVHSSRQLKKKKKNS
eukprot:4873098-Prymnesium_polylepis.1